MTPMLETLRAWLWNHLFTLLGGSASVPLLGYLAQKYGDKILDALPAWLKRRRAKYLTDFRDYYRDEMAMHAHTFVATQTRATPEHHSHNDAVESISQWVLGPQPFLILFGERGIGKSRSCIEFAEKANHSKRTYVMKRDRVRWINTKGYESPELCTALRPLIKRGMVYVYDSYRESENLLESIAVLIFRSGGKLLVVSYETEGPAKKLRGIARPLETSPRAMAADDLQNVVRARAVKAGCQVDDVTMDKISGLANGVPEVAVLCVDRIASRGRLEGIDTLDNLYASILNDLETRLKDEWPKVKNLLGKMVLMRGIPKDEIKDYSAPIANALSAGQIVLENSILRLKPDVLSEWMASRIYFPHDNTSLEFDLILDGGVNGKFADVLITLINLGKRGEAAKLLHKAVGQPPRVVVELGVLACEGFKQINLVEQSLGRFWEQVEGVDDADLHNRVASVLSTQGKWKEAHACWVRAAELYENASNSWGVTQMQANTAAMYLRLSNWDLAEKFYRRALEAAAQVPDELGQFAIARLHNNIGLMYANRGEGEKAVQEQKVARDIYGRLPGDIGIQGIGQTELILGSYYHRIRDLKQALFCYKSAQQIMEKSRDWPGLARVYSNLSLICADQGDWKTAVELDSKALNMLAELGDLRSIADVYQNFASLYQRKDDYMEALRCYTLERETLESIADAIGVAQVDMLLGEVYERQGDRIRATEQFRRSATVFENLGDIRNRANCELSLGALYHNRGDRDAAREQYAVASREFDRCQDDRGKALVALNLGTLCRERGLWQETTEHYHNALKIFERIQDQLAIASTLRRMGDLRREGYADSAEALFLYRKALDITNSMGAFRESMGTYTEIASVYLAQGRSYDALKLYTDALQGFRTLGSRQEEAWTLLGISSIHSSREDLVSAEEICKNALGIGKALENVDLIAAANSALAWLHERKADWTTAARLFEDARDTFRKIGAPLAAAEASRSLGWIHFRWGNLNATEQCCDEAQDIFAAVQYRPGLAGVYGLRAEVYVERHDFEQAFDLYRLAEKIATDLNNLNGLALLYNNKALAKHRAGNLEEAISLCNQSLDLSHQLIDERTKSYSETTLGMCYRDKHDWEKAMEHFRRGIQIKKKLDDDYGLANSDAEVGIMDRERGRLEEAEEGLTRAFQSFRRLGAAADARRVGMEIRRLAGIFRDGGRGDRAKRMEEILNLPPEAA